MHYPAPADWFEYLSSPGTVQRLFWTAADNSFRGLGLRRIVDPRLDAVLGRLVEKWMDRQAPDAVPAADLSYVEVFDDYCRLACMIFSSGLEVPVAASVDINTQLPVGANRHASLRTAAMQWPASVITLIFAARLCEIADAILVHRQRAPNLLMQIPNSTLIAGYAKAIGGGMRSDAHIYEAVQEIAHIRLSDRAVPLS